MPPKGYRSISLNDKLYERLERRAKKEKRKPSNLAACIIEETLDAIEDSAVWLVEHPDELKRQRIERED